jgi:hypothetical protein
VRPQEHWVCMRWLCVLWCTCVCVCVCVRACMWVQGWWWGGGKRVHRAHPFRSNREQALMAGLIGGLIGGHMHMIMPAVVL